MLMNELIWIVINIAMSISFIYLGHYLWNYIKDTYSTKKTKDLVNTQIQKYKKMMVEIQENNNTNNESFLNDNEKVVLDQRLMEFMEGTYEKLI
jgi:hypothetical protein